MIVPLAPEMVFVVASFAVSVWLPDVVKVAENVPMPPESVLLAGSTVDAPLSLLLNVTEPA